MYLKGKMCDLLQIFSFAHHRIEDLESACLRSHVEVVAVITVCYVFKNAGGEHFCYFVYASQSRKSKTSFKVAIVQEVSGMFGIAC